MALAVRRRHDAAPSLAPLEGMTVRRETSADFMSALQGKPAAEMARRMAAGHRAYVAWRGGEPAAWGWIATRSADIGELGTTFDLPPGERYLWNFVTLAAHRGLGIYPRLVDAIVRAESAEGERFWIACAPENHASGSGILKAGFRTVAELSFDAEGRPAVQALDAEGGAAAARLLGLPLADDDLAPCWRCVRAGHVDACAPGHCCCDYQRAEIDCAA